MLDLIKIIDERKTKKKKTTTKTEQTEKNEGVTEVLVKGWELNDFVVRLN